MNYYALLVLLCVGACDEAQTDAPSNAAPPVIDPTGVEAEAQPDEVEPESESDPLRMDHLGLVVRDLQTTRRFFIDALGFEVVGGDDEYPASFMVRGSTRITLWQVEDPESATPFDRRNNIGLHHFALGVASLEVLNEMHERIRQYPGVTIEFAPEIAYGGPAQHMMFREPGGIRMEIMHRP